MAVECKVPCKKLAPLKNCAFLRFAAQPSTGKRLESAARLVIFEARILSKSRYSTSLVYELPLVNESFTSLVRFPVRTSERS